MTAALGGAKTEEGTWEMGNENRSTYEHEESKSDGEVPLDQRGDQLCDNNGRCVVEGWESAQRSRTLAPSVECDDLYGRLPCLPIFSPSSPRRC